jgi:hypothetical protein
MIDRSQKEAAKLTRIRVAREWATTSEEPDGFEVWCTTSSLKDLVVSLASEITLDGEPVIVVDALGVFDPSNLAQSPVCAATNLRVLKTGSSSELQTALWTILKEAGQGARTRRVLMAGVLEHLYGKDLLTRDAARVLGRMKLALDAMVQSGMDVVVVCNACTDVLGVRSYLLPSLCAAAAKVHVFPSAAQQHIDRPASAIA